MYCSYRWFFLHVHPNACLIDVNILINEFDVFFQIKWPQLLESSWLCLSFCSASLLFCHRGKVVVLKHGVDVLDGVLGVLASCGIHVTEDASALVATAVNVWKFLHLVPQLVMLISVNATEVMAKENRGGVGLVDEWFVFLMFNHASFVAEKLH